MGECGVAHPGLLKPDYGGIASGWGLDRLAMIVKGMDDIRLLRSTHPQIASQMTHLEPYHFISNQPSISRDMSIVTDVSTELEDICEKIVEALGVHDELLETVEILSETHYQQLPSQAIERLGMQPYQKNFLVRMTLRILHSSITNHLANELRDVVYQQIHQGV